MGFNRYEILAYSDLKRFTHSGRDDLYAYYPQLIDKIAARSELAGRVEMVHLSVSDFRSPEYEGRDFSSLASLPNLRTVECTYSHNVDAFTPILNRIASLNEVGLYYCDPIVQTLQDLNNDSLRSIKIHTYKITEIPDDVLNAFAQRMPECTISVTTD